MVIALTRDRKRIKIEDARNLGPTTASEFAAMGVHYLDQIEEMGWEDFCLQYVEHFPERLNLNAFTAVIGALEDQDWRDVSPSQKARAKTLIKQIKAGIF